MSALKPFLAPVVVAVVSLAGMSSCQNTAFREHIEEQLAANSQEALSTAGLDAAEVSFTGRDATVEAATTADAATASSVIGEVAGVRTVTAIGPDGEVDPDAVAAGNPADGGDDSGSGGGSGSTDDSASGDAAGDEASEDPGDAPDDASEDDATGSDEDSSEAEDDAAREPTKQEKEEAQDDLVEIPNITFVTDSARLTASGEKVVRHAADVLGEHPEVEVRIDGHTDSRGDADHNLELSERRADTVRDRLVELGVDESQLSVKGFGESDPLVAPMTFADLEKNRRVEFTVLD